MGYSIMSTAAMKHGTYLTFVTQQSSPVDVAHTLPGFGAAPIHTAGERLTLVTQGTYPAIMTPGRVEHRRVCSCHIERIRSDCLN